MWCETSATLFDGASSRRRRLCNGGIISNVCGGGNGTAWGAVVVVEIASSSGADTFGRGVTAVGDLDAIIAERKATNEEEEKQEYLTHGSDSQVNRGNDFFRTLRESILPDCSMFVVEE